MNISAKVSEVLEFLDIAADKGFINDNTANNRRTAIKKFADILEEPEKTVEYMKDNLASIKSRFLNLNKDISGGTADEYVRRVSVSLKDFCAWKQDRAGWERDVSNRSANRAANAEGEAKPRKVKTEKPKSQAEAAAANGNSNFRTVTFPIREDFDVTINLPRDGLTVAELKKLAYFLLPYAKDWDPNDARNDFPALNKP
jgi:hypothetical protein